MNYEKHYMNIANRALRKALLQFILALLLGALLLGACFWFALRNRQPDAAPIKNACARPKPRTGVSAKTDNTYRLTDRRSNKTTRLSIRTDKRGSASSNTPGC